MKSTFLKNGFPNAANKEHAMSGLEVMKEFQALQERIVDKDLIKKILELWPCE